MILNDGVILSITLTTAYAALKLCANIRFRDDLASALEYILVVLYLFN